MSATACMYAACTLPTAILSTSASNTASLLVALLLSEVSSSSIRATASSWFLMPGNQVRSRPTSSCSALCLTASYIALYSDSRMVWSPA
ncbi:hypothetical protein COO60DRAFT_398677 [Scenedesmus sp. NREL 46B-D3]|nr:hypothetical protein COO60DRAFT_398677 [Scenedesmus sp. NREL 46B-D3]